jgi:plastin-1
MHYLQIIGNQSED